MPEKPEIKLAPAKPSLSDTNARDAFIGIALRELLKQAIEKGDFGKWDMIADNSVRCADAVMRSRAQEPKTLTSGVGKVERDIPPQLPATWPPPTPGEAPKSIAELIGEAPELAEVK
jgi:hypothetical protein